MHVWSVAEPLSPHNARISSATDTSTVATSVIRRGEEVRWREPFIISLVARLYLRARAQTEHFLIGLSTSVQVKEATSLCCRVSRFYTRTWKYSEYNYVHSCTVCEVEYFPQRRNILTTPPSPTQFGRRLKAKNTCIYVPFSCRTGRQQLCQ